MTKARAKSKKGPKPGTTLYGINRLNEAGLRAAAEKEQSLAKKEKLLSPERKAHAKKAHELMKAAQQAKNAAKIARGNPAKLWDSDPKKRPIGGWGIVGTLLGPPSDAILDIAGGARPGPGLIRTEMRRSILAGLMALKTTGHSKVNVKKLKAPLVGSKQSDAALAKAVGSSSLEAAYEKVKKMVGKYGPDMKKLAWGFRIQLWMKEVKIIETVHAAAGAVAGVFLPIGTIVGAGIAAHSAITMAIAAALGTKSNQMIAEATDALKKKAEVAAAKKADAETQEQLRAITALQADIEKTTPTEDEVKQDVPAPAAWYTNPMVLALSAGALVVGIAVAVKSTKQQEPQRMLPPPSAP